MMPSEHFLEVSELKQLYMEGLIMRMGYARFEAILEDLKRSLNLGTSTIEVAGLTATSDGKELREDEYTCDCKGFEYTQNCYHIMTVKILMGTKA